MHVEYISAITARYERLGYAPYRWYYADTEPPWQPLSKPLSDCRVGMLSTSGAYAAGQVAYFYKDDASIRHIPKTVASEDMRFSHVTENYLVDPRRDPNCIFPIDALHRAEAEGEIGSLADEVFSCMGGVYSQRRVREEMIPALAEGFRKQEVDVAFLVAM